ncbi:HlyD family type I secretion periplasmic adaptor subunit [Xenorhabdus sp. 42]|nr:MULTISPECIES: HlyD family type I secretion periplasmic adaptor subunit [Xenorhabdus]MBD2793478.1 HlyD family type I secretion periplasmic adaptor subunit [Xenorhabdus sp. CUL]MBD2806659.1 HlyD family type I secretion periplasmic adaptor subunit [Xenorhabdus sp. ZM]MBD2822525.1 HlyD family type I secretion periplasmic adaptor subunit [Xenorhabdus sp. 42]MBD2826836.1 HlyD family type I secretion periplasmic adaptor subunit [Xenorhabdus sp. 5]
MPKTILRKGMKRLRTRTPSPDYDFLPTHLALSQRPPSPFARYTAITLSIGVLVALLWACLGKLDVQATATGRLIASGRSQIIQAYEQSRIVAIHVGNGQHVAKGTPLLTLHTLGVNQDIARLLEQRDYLTEEEIRYQALLGKHDPSSLPLFQQQPEAKRNKILTHYHHEKEEFDSVITNIYAEMEVNLSSQKARNSDIRSLINLRENIYQRLQARKTLSQKQVISKVEYLEQEKEFLETERLISQQKSELGILLTQYKSLEERLKGLKVQKEREWFEKGKQAEMQLAVLKQEISKVQEREELEIVRSPVTGTIQQLSVHTLGAVLQPAQNLMVIVPDNQVQLAEIQILNKDVGFVRPGQQVTVKVDAFPYTRYGTIEGTLLSISRDSTTDERLGLVFPAQISLKQNNIIVDGKPVDITAGMSIVAEIKTDQRRVIDYLLSPIQEYQSEALREK